MSAAVLTSANPVEQESRLIAFLRGRTVDVSGLEEIAVRYGVAAPVAHLLGVSAAYAGFNVWGILSTATGTAFQIGRYY